MARLKLDGSDKRPDDIYDPVALSKGIEVEYEHTNDPEVAKLIAKDHLDESPLYYDFLEAMERRLTHTTMSLHGKLKASKRKKHD